LCRARIFAHPQSPSQGIPDGFFYCVLLSKTCNGHFNRAGRLWTHTAGCGRAVLSLQFGPNSGEAAQYSPAVHKNRARLVAFILFSQSV
jgi:hypothetical protein